MTFEDWIAEHGDALERAFLDEGAGWSELLDWLECAFGRTRNAHIKERRTNRMFNEHNLRLACSGLLFVAGLGLAVYGAITGDIHTAEVGGGMMGASGLTAWSTQAEAVAPKAG